MTPPPGSGGAGHDAGEQYRDVPRLRDAPRWLWIWFPIASLAVVFAARGFGEDFYHRVMATEQGVVEIGTVVILLFAIAAGVLSFRRRRSLPNRWLGHAPRNSEPSGKTTRASSKGQTTW